MTSSRFVRLVLVMTLLVGGTTFLPDSPASATAPFEEHRGGSFGGRWRTVATSSSGDVAVIGQDYAGAGAKLRLTVDQGSTWTEMDSAILQWTSVDISSNGQTIVAAGNNGITQSVHRSDDQGQTWSILLSSTTNSFTHVAMSNDGQRIVVAGASYLRSSTNGGSTWSDYSAGGALASVDVSGDGSVFYAATNGELMKSTDGGQSWATLAAAGSHHYSSVSTSDDGSVVLGVVSYAQPAIGAFYSRDEGLNFQAASTVGATFVNQVAIGEVSGDGSTMVVTSYGTVPQISTDGGVTWGPNQFAGRSWMAFASSTNGEVIHGVTEGSGVFVRRPTPPPSINGFSRTSVSSTGGQMLVLEGSSFVNVDSVFYEGQSVPYDLVSSTEIEISTLAAAGPMATVAVTTASGSATATIPVYVPPAPAVVSMSPSTGSWVGDDRVTLRGSGFVDVRSVTVGGRPAGFNPISDSELEIFIPPGRVGWAEVRVTTLGGQANLARGYKYTWQFRNSFRQWQPLTTTPVFNDAVFDMVEDPNGDLFFVGDFSNGASIAEADRVIRWDGNEWSALGSDGAGDGALQGSFIVSSVVDSSGRLFVGGVLELNSEIETQGVAMWDGTSWTGLGSFSGTVWTLALDSSGNLLAAGDFNEVDGHATSSIVRWNGTTWSSLAPTPAGIVIWGIARDESDIYVVGDFENMGGLPAADVVARWDGSNWHALISSDSGDGLQGLVPIVVRVEGSVFKRVLVGGCPSADESPSVFAFEAGRWSAVSTTNLNDGCVLDMERLDDGRLVVAGAFQGVDNPLISGVAVLENGSWVPAGRVGWSKSITMVGRPSRLVIGTFDGGIDEIDDSVAVAGDLDLMSDLTVASMEPASGSIDGGAIVTIRGNGFSSATDVVFGEFPATSVTLLSDTELRVVVPAQEESVVDVYVYDERQISTLSQSFRFIRPAPTVLPSTGNDFDDTLTMVALGACLVVAGSSTRRLRRSRIR